MAASYRDQFQLVSYSCYHLQKQRLWIPVPISVCYIKTRLYIRAHPYKRPRLYNRALGEMCCLTSYYKQLIKTDD